MNAPLQTHGDGSGERVGIFLTNALTGWEPLRDPKSQVLPFPELAAERDAANSVKREQKILVILGNPPYNGYAGVVMGEERELSNAYRTATAGPQPQGQGLNELYVRFFRMAERQIVEHSGRGIVCFISNHSWLDGLSHPAMRERFLQVFDHIRIDNLQGDKYRTGKLTPAGEPDPSAFSTAQNREGIQVGTAITTLVRREQPAHTALVAQRDWWGRTKLADLEQACDSLDAVHYAVVTPHQALGWAFSAQVTSAAYLSWPTLPELFPFSVSGVQTKRDDALVDMQREPLLQRMAVYFDREASEVLLGATVPSLTRDSNRFEHKGIRASLLTRGFLPDNVVPFLYRPFDLRWIYWEPETKLLGEKSPDFFPQVFPDNVWLLTTGRTRKGDPEPPIVTSRLADLNLMDSGVRAMPLFVRAQHSDLLGTTTSANPNLSKAAETYLANLDASPEDLFFHAIAVMHSSVYRRANAGALRQDWPRIPLPASLDVLHKSAALGRQVAALLDTETAVVGVSAGTPRAELKSIASPARDDGKPLAAADFALACGWGHAGQRGVTMPGKGRVADRAASPVEAASGFGGTTHDVYLNAQACWRHVPDPVWSYTLGGYQVLKKWLSYREQGLLGRALTLDEVKSFTAIARRIAALVHMRSVLDANCARVARSLP